MYLLCTSLLIYLDVAINLTQGLLVVLSVMFHS